MTDDRRARLAALAAKAGRKFPSSSTPSREDTENNELTSSNEEPAVSVKFRNYAPQDDKLEEAPLAQDESASGEAPKGNVTHQTKRRRMEESGSSEEMNPLEMALVEAKREALSSSKETAKALGAAGVEGDDVVALAPRKVNWDLKRDLQPKLDKLERRTQRAIVQILRERLEREAAQEEGGDSDDDDLD